MTVPKGKLYYDREKYVNVGTEIIIGKKRFQTGGVMYRKKLLYLSIALFTLSFFTGCTIRYSINGSARELKLSEANEFTVEKTAVEPIKEINIDTRMADIEILPGDDYYVEIAYLYWEKEPLYTLEGGILTFNDRDSLPESYSINFHLNNTIKVYLPKEALIDLIDADTSNGDIEAKGFTTKQALLRTSYGGLTVEDAAAVNAKFTLSSGNSKVKNFTAGELSYTNSYGEAEFTNINTDGVMLPDNASYQSFHATLSSGSCTISGISFNSMDITDSYGNITCEEVSSEDFEVSLSSGDLKVTKAALKKTDIRNSYGDVTLSLSGSEEDYRLDLSTSYGDIKVGDDSFEGHLQRENNGDRELKADLSSGNIKISFTN